MIYINKRRNVRDEKIFNWYYFSVGIVHIEC